MDDSLPGKEVLCFGRNDVLQQDVAIAAVGRQRHEAAERAPQRNDGKPRSAVSPVAR